MVILKSLSEGTMFNIYGFGSNFETLFDESKEYSEQSLSTAINHCASLRADLGGTEILRPLLDILTKPTKEGYPRQVFLLTDGQVGNRADCINQVRKWSDTTRVFTFAISSAADKALCEGMAEAGNGSCEVILDNEDMEAKVVKQLRRAMTPALSDISIEWGSLADAVSPYFLPPVFAGNRMIVYGFLKKQEKEEKGKITLKGVTALNEFTTTVEIDPAKATKSELFHQLGAKAMIRDLQEKRSFMHTRNQTLKTGYTDQSVRDEMIRLSTKYGVICPYTAFVAVEEAEIKQEKQTEQQPDAKPKMREKEKEEGQKKEKKVFKDKKNEAKDKGKGGERVEERRRVMKKSEAMPEREQKDCKKKRKGKAAPAAKRSLIQKPLGLGGDSPAFMKNKKGVKGLIITQSFNGCWNLTAVSEALSVTTDVLKKAIPDASKPELETVWATFVAIAFLELLCVENKVKWDLIAQKAKRWLKKQGVSWEEQAIQFIKTAGIKA